ncbi:MAG: T9SS type A sorting domain-containing protein [Bacteroidetes bacterium]|nr:T9SS type A sorting domain-containing protein [Bacteroidota bacterium]
MKQGLFALAIILFASQISMAQTKNKLTNQQKHQQIIKQLLHQQTNPLVAKKIRGGSRLISNATSTVLTPAPITFEPVDSTNYFYKAGYGYDPTSEVFTPDFDINFLYDDYKNYYDSSYHLSYDNFSSTWSGSDSTVCNFTTGHKMAHKKSSFFIFTGFTSNTYVYDGMGRKTEQLDSSDFSGSGTPDISKYLFTLNASNKVTFLEYKIWDNGLMTWVSDYKDSIFYNANNDISLIKSYTYNGSGWDADYLITINYTGANKISNILYQFWDSGSSTWLNEDKTEFTYNGSNQMMVTKYLTWDAGAWMNNSLDSMYYGAGNYPVKRVIYEWKTSSLAWEAVSRNDYTYNSLDQITQDMAYFWNTSLNSLSLDKITDYHYASYTPQAVQESANIQSQVKVYPIPAQNKLNVNINRTESKSSILSICDVSGKILSTYTLPNTTSVQQELNITDLAAGIYLLTITGEENYTTRFVKE